jgi:hypothetical protein
LSSVDFVRFNILMTEIAVRDDDVDLGRILAAIDSLSAKEVSEARDLCDALLCEMRSNFLTAEREMARIEQASVSAYPYRLSWGDSWQQAYDQEHTAEKAIPHLETLLSALEQKLTNGQSTKECSSSSPPETPVGAESTTRTGEASQDPPPTLPSPEASPPIESKQPRQSTKKTKPKKNYRTELGRAIQMAFIRNPNASGKEVIEFLDGLDGLEIPPRLKTKDNEQTFGLIWKKRTNQKRSLEVTISKIRCAMRKP